MHSDGVADECNIADPAGADAYKVTIVKLQAGNAYSGCRWVHARWTYSDWVAGQCMDIATGSLIADAAASKACMCKIDIANLSAADDEYSGCR